MRCPLAVCTPNDDAEFWEPALAQWVGAPRPLLLPLSCVQDGPDVTAGPGDGTDRPLQSLTCLAVLLCEFWYRADPNAQQPRGWALAQR